MSESVFSSSLAPIAADKSRSQAEQRQSGRLGHGQDLSAKLAVWQLKRCNVHIPKTALEFSDLRGDERERTCPKGRTCRTTEAINRRITKSAATLKCGATQIENYGAS